MLSVPLIGRLYKQDNLTLNTIILRNISDASYAFTYVKPYINKEDGRSDIKVLRSRYENVAIKEKYVRKPKCKIETLQYRKERDMTFEEFVRKIVQAVDELEKRDRVMHNYEVC